MIGEQRVINFDLVGDSGTFTISIKFTQKTNNPMSEAFELVKSDERYKDNIYYWWWIQ